MSQDLLPTLTRAADVLARDGSPHAAFAAVDAAAQSLVGHELFTVLLCLPGGEEVERAYSSRPDAYPVQGRKRLGSTPWGDLVLARRQPFLGPDKAAIRWAFADHPLIESLGLGSVINVGVEHGGDLLAVLALLHREGYLCEDAQVARIRALTPLLIPALRSLRD